MPTYTNGLRSNRCSIGVIPTLGLCLGGMTGAIGGASMGLHLMCGVEISNTEGLPAPPSLLIRGPSLWRFRWVLHTSINTIQVDVKQAANIAVRPSIVVKANPDCGVNADSSSSAASSAGWVTIGPLTVSPSGVGAVFVELHNNVVTQWADCFFKNLIIT